MLDHTSLKPEMRYGCPSADQVLENRFYSIGYSFYFRQAKWALEIVDPDKKDMEEVDRLNNFRPDFRVPKGFRADLSDYAGSGYDRGHLVASANLNDEHIQNSETFLLSNMSPQTPRFNRSKWRQLESAVRALDKNPKVLETYVMTGPVFDFSKAIAMIGEKDKNGVSIPVPSHFFKCVLTEELNGTLKMWAFEMKNSSLRGGLENFQVTTTYLEKRTGMLIWGNLTGPEIEKEKARIRRIWK